MSTGAAPPGTIGPVYLITGEPGPAAADAAPPFTASQAMTGGGATLLAILAVLAVLRQRRRIAAAMDPADLALRSLAWRLHLSRADRALVRRLASANIAGWPRPVHPVALLVSRHAFDAAAAAAADCSSKDAAARIARIRRRAFGAGESVSPATPGRSTPPPPTASGRPSVPVRDREGTPSS